MYKMKFIMLLVSMIGAAGCSGYRTVSVDEFSEVIGNREVQLVDVRTAPEYAEGHLPGALNLDMGQPGFMEDASAVLDKNRPVAVYCRSGRRSAEAAASLAGSGFKVIDMKGGILDWTAEGKDVTADVYEVDSFRTASGKIVRFHALMHSSMLIDYDGLVIYVDPVRRNGGREVDYSPMPKADYIFVTHQHGDHLDAEAISMLSGESTMLVTNAACAELLGYGGIMANGDELSLREDIKVEAFPAYNTTEDHLQYHPKGRDNAYIFTFDGLRVYIAGDTEDIPEMASLKDIDIAFLPCNQPFTMTPEQLVRAAGMFGPKVLFPYHYGQTDVSGIPDALPETDVRIRHYE